MIHDFSGPDFPGLFLSKQRVWWLYPLPCPYIIDSIIDKGRTREADMGVGMTRPPDIFRQGRAHRLRVIDTAFRSR